MLTLPEKVLFAIIVIASTVWFVRRGTLLVRLVRLGQPEAQDRSDGMGARVANVLADVFFQRKVLRKPVAGFFHLLIVWGFVIFAVNTINHFAGAFLTGFHLFGATKLALIYEAVADIFAVLILVGVVGLAFRRYVARPPNLTKPSPESAIVFAAIGGAMAAYLWVHATYIALGTLENPQYHFAAAQIAKVFTSWDEGVLRVMAHVAWWCDGLLHLLLVALLIIPTKHAHLVAGPINLLYGRSRHRGQMTKLDLEDENAETFGVSKINEFTWKQLLDFGACIECGRCQEYCPTHNSGKPLSPKKLIVDLKNHLLEAGPLELSGESDGAKEVPALIGATIDKETIWACTTCGACVEHCPMGIEHVDKITDMRRHMTLMEADFPEQAETAFRNMEGSGNPWGFGASERTAWAKGLDVSTFAEKREADVLYWVGCSGSFDDRNKKIAVAMVKILNAANVDFAILGDEERCTCESARRLGNEYLYQTATQEIIETLNKYTFSKILVTCPHCLNTLANEYPEFGGDYTVVHHAQFIDQLVSEGKLNTDGKAKQNSGGKTAFHDSCYLARYNDVEDEPRRVLEASGRTLAPVARQGKEGFCCGAGGGRMWVEEDLGEPINGIRAKELIASGAEEIGTSCPFCMTMVSDGVKREEREDIPVRDIAEIIADQISTSL
jgi:Fe-S oxidoreductase